MPDPEDAEKAASCWAWLERWLEPPGRALFTWLALAGIMGALADTNVFNQFNNGVTLLIVKMSSIGDQRMKDFIAITNLYR